MECQFARSSAIVKANGFSVFRVFLAVMCWPFEALLYVIAYGVFSVLYLQLVLVPLALFLSFAFPLWLLNFIQIETVYGLGALGAIGGLIWAEKIRKTYSIFGFHGYLMGHPEIDGWQQPSLGRVFRNGNLTEVPCSRD